MKLSDVLERFSHNLVLELTIQIATNKMQNDDFRGLGGERGFCAHKFVVYARNFKALINYG